MVWINCEDVFRVLADVWKPILETECCYGHFYLLLHTCLHHLSGESTNSLYDFEDFAGNHETALHGQMEMTEVLASSMLQFQTVLCFATNLHELALNCMLNLTCSDLDGL